MVIDSGSLADEQRIELRQTHVVFGADDLDIDAQRLALLDELVDSTLVARREGLLRIQEHGQIIA